MLVFLAIQTGVLGPLQNLNPPQHSSAPLEPPTSWLAALPKPWCSPGSHLSVCLQTPRLHLLAGCFTEASSSFRRSPQTPGSLVPVALPLGGGSLQALSHLALLGCLPVRILPGYPAVGSTILGRGVRMWGAASVKFSKPQFSVGICLQVVRGVCLGGTKSCLNLECCPTALQPCPPCERS